MPKRIFTFFRGYPQTSSRRVKKADADEPAASMK